MTSLTILSTTLIVLIRIGRRVMPALFPPADHLGRLHGRGIAEKETPHRAPLLGISPDLDAEYFIVQSPLTQAPGEG